MPLPHTAGVYCLRHSTTGHCYVGSSRDMYGRYYRHLALLKAGRHHSRYLQNAWAKYGADAFIWEVLECVEDAALLLGREQIWIDRLHPVYNVSPKATAPNLGRHLSEEWRASMSAAHKGRKQTPEWAAKRAAAWVGRKHTDEARAKMRKPKRPRAPMSEEHKAKIRAALIGRSRKRV